MLLLATSHGKLVMCYQLTMSATGILTAVDMHTDTIAMMRTILVFSMFYSNRAINKYLSIIEDVKYKVLNECVLANSLFIHHYICIIVISIFLIAVLNCLPAIDNIVL